MTTTSKYYQFWWPIQDNAPVAYPASTYNSFTYNLGVFSSATLSHRMSGCQYGDRLLSLVPRDCSTTNDGNKQNYIKGMSYLDIQANPVTPAANRTASDEWCFSFTDGITWQVGSETRSKGTANRYLTAMTSNTVGATYGFWIEAPPNDGAASSVNVQVNVATVRLDANGDLIQPDPTTNRVFDLTYVRLAAVRDFAAVAYGPYSVLFFMFWGDTTLHYALFDGETMSGIYTTGINFPGPLYSFDCSVVYRGSTNGTNAEQIALVGIHGTGDGQKVDTYLIQPMAIGDIPNLKSDVPATGFIKSNEQISVPAIPSGFIPNNGATVRCAWGVLRDNGTFAVDLKASSLLIVFSPSVLNEDTYLREIVVCGAPFIAQIDLTEGADNSNQPWEGFSIDTDYQNVASAVMADMSCFYEVALNGGYSLTGQDPKAPDTGGQAAFFVANSVTFDARGSTTVKSITMTSCQLPSYRLIGLPYEADNENQLTYSAQMTDQEIQAAAGAWTLIGVIAGAAPTDTASGQSSNSGTTSTVTVANVSEASETDSYSVSTSWGVNAKVGGEGVEISGGYSQTSFCKYGSGLSFTASDSQSTSNPPSSDDASATVYPLLEYGWLYFMAPNLTRGDYDLQTWDGSSLSGLTVAAIFPTGGSNHFLVPFCLKTPNTPATYNVSGALLDMVASFDLSGLETHSDPNQTGFPVASDVPGWTDFAKSLNFATPGLFVNNYVEYNSRNPGAKFTVVVMDSIQVQPGWKGDSRYAFDSSTSIEQNNSSKLKFEASDEIGPLKFSTDYDSEAGSSTIVSGEKTFQIEVEYSAANSEEGWKSFTITPYLFFADGPGLFWVPSNFADQRPWLLTWRVA